MRKYASGWLIASFLLLSACGDPLVDGSYLGTALFELSGNVRVDSSPPSAPVRIGLIWSGTGVTSTGEQVLTRPELPARYRLTLFDEPPEDARHPEEDGPDWAIGRIIMFADGDDDHVLDSGEAVVGGSEDFVVLWTSHAGRAAPVGTHLDQGYHLAFVLYCGEREDGVALERRAADTEVDLRVTGHAPKRVADLDCGQGPDDLCYELSQRRPLNEDEQRIWEEQCAQHATYEGVDRNFCEDFDYEDPVIEDLCTQHFDSSKCIEEHLTGAEAWSDAEKSEHLHAFGECAGPFDPCYREYQEWLVRADDESFHTYEFCLETAHDLAL